MPRLSRTGSIFAKASTFRVRGVPVYLSGVGFYGVFTDIFSYTCISKITGPTGPICDAVFDNMFGRTREV